MKKLIRKYTRKYVIDGATYFAVDVGYHHDMDPPVGPFYIVRDEKGRDLGMVMRLACGGYDGIDGERLSWRLGKIVEGFVRRPDPNIYRKIRIHNEIRADFPSKR